MKTGYFETQRDENVFNVVFISDHIGREKTYNFVLLRGAELTLENGFQYFSVADAKIFNDTSDFSSAKTASNTITCFKEKPETVFTYDAKVVYEEIRQKYGITDATK